MSKQIMKYSYNIDCTHMFQLDDFSNYELDYPFFYQFSLNLVTNNIRTHQMLLLT